MSHEPGDGEERRAGDSTQAHILRELGAIRLASAKNANDLLACKGNLEEMSASVKHISNIMERGKAVVWVLTVLGGFLAFAETQWRWLSKIVKALS